MLNRSVGVWKINDLIWRVNPYAIISKEHTAWSHDKEERLIDSLENGMDIGAIYLLRHPEHGLICLDGLGRIKTLIKYAMKSEFFPSKQRVLCNQVSVVIFDWKEKDLERELNLQFLRLQISPVRLNILNQEGLT